MRKPILVLAVILCVLGTAGVAAADTSYMFTDLGSLGGGYSIANRINNAGQVVGMSRTTNGLSHAYLYSGGAMTDLGTLGGNYSQAYDINDAGQVVGQSTTTGGSCMLSSITARR